jgi:hypothetical protein
LITSVADGRGARSWRRPPVILSAADFEAPHDGATCRSARFVRQYVATSSSMSSSDSRLGRPLNVATTAPYRPTHGPPATWVMGRPPGGQSARQGSMGRGGALQARGTDAPGRYGQSLVAFSPRGPACSFAPSM